MSSKKIDLSDEVIKELIRILKAASAPNGILFGSRVTGKSRKNSDIDICIRSEDGVPHSLLGTLSELAEESSIPYIVEFSDYEALPDNFRAQIDRDGINIFDLA